MILQFQTKSFGGGPGGACTLCSSSNTCHCMTQISVELSVAFSDLAFYIWQRNPPAEPWHLNLCQDCANRLLQIAGVIYYSDTSRSPSPAEVGRVAAQA
jgi:hypothetical protein